MRRVAVVLLVLLLACGCASSGPQADDRSGADLSGAEAFPNDTLQDWVTYGDHLITAEVRPTTEDGRVELLRTGTMWSRPAAPAAPGAVRRWADGAGPQGVELETGHSYLTLLFRWNPTGQAVERGSMDTLSFDDGIVGRGLDQCWPAGSLLAREQLWGLDEAGVRQHLSSTAPDPLAAPYADLAPTSAMSE